MTTLWNDCCESEKFVFKKIYQLSCFEYIDENLRVWERGVKNTENIKIGKQPVSQIKKYGKDKTIVKTRTGKMSVTSAIIWKKIIRLK